MQDIFISVGLDISDMTKSISDATTKVTEFVDKTKDGFASVGKVGNSMTGIGQKIANGLNSAVNTALEFEDSLSRVGKMSGLTDNELQSLQNTSQEITAQQKELSDAKEAAAIAIAAILLPAIKKLNDVLLILLSWFNGLSSTTKSIIGVLGALGAGFLLVAGQVLILMGTLPGLIQGFNNIASIFGLGAKAFALVLAKVGLLTIAIVAIGVALVYAYNEFEWFHNIVNGIWRGVVAGAQMAWDAIKKGASVLADVLAPAVKAVQIAFTGLASIISGDFAQGGEILSSILPEPVVSFILSAAEQVSNAISGLVENITQAFQGDFSGVAQFIPTIMALFVGGLPGLILTGAKFLPALEEGINSYLPTMLDGFSSMIEQLIESITAQAPAILETGASIVIQLVEGLASALPTILEAAVELITVLVESIITILPMLLDTGIMILTTLLEGIISMVPMLMETAIELITTLVETWVTLLPLILEAGISFLTALIEGLVTALPILMEALLEIVMTLVTVFAENLPLIVEAGIQVLNALIEGIVSLLPMLMTTALELLQTIIDIVIDNLPAILDAGIQILTALINGIMDVLPLLLSTALTLIVSLADMLIANLPTIISTGISLLMALIDGIIQMLPMLLTTAVNLVIQLGAMIISMLPQILSAGVQLLLALIRGVVQIIPRLLSTGGRMIGQLARAIIERVPRLLSAGKDLIRGLWNGISSMKDWVLGKISGFMDNIVDNLLSFFGIKSPSKLFRDDIGQWLPKGLAVGIEGNVNAVDKALDVMTNLVPSTVDAPVMAPMEVARPNVNGGFIQGELAVTGGSATSNTESLLSQVVDELRKQKDRIIEMDSRIVGRLVEPYVSENQGRNTRIKQSFV
ncbi:hypothetical protein HXA34_06835 [Salipaludibacillus agaradhaerens]|uniref:hypothetical protein n=1 Tax=Salipaludibacillus agaradhaerens TaxID=76935 RepID=UPI00215112C8|nr:hypothetical protein [Salipaludibacillus agaradhaerens]MCR6105993.1 hypothetical protein [Salipaludibacillus agaradhaerens]MCR6118026.1 hypothetical protein [Salipaludibacillus agaradhaerens]